MSASDISFGHFRLDPADCRLWRGAEALTLTPKAFAVLHYLAAHAGQLVLKNDLLDALWPNTFVEEAVLKVQISEIRKVLGDEPRAPAFIETHHRRGYRFIAAVRNESPSSRAADESTAVVGRERELALLAAAFERAAAGVRQFVFIGGEAGIGKTALVGAFAARLPNDAAVGRGQCLDHHGSSEAYLPVLEAVADLARDRHAAAAADILRRSAPTWLTQLPWLLEPQDHERLQRELLGTTRDRMQREMAEAVELLSADRCLVLVFEDIHWSDPSTVELLSRLAHRPAAAHLLVVGTYRPVDAAVSGHPVRALIHRLRNQKLCTEIHVPFLTGDEVAQALQQHIGASSISEDVIDAVLYRTGGNPLFVVSLIEHLRERGLVVPTGTGWTLAGCADRIRDEVPETLFETITEQMAGLATDELSALEAASVIGLEFPVAAVAAVLDAHGADVEERCEAEVAHRRYLRAVAADPSRAGSLQTRRYAFRHSLHRDVLYRKLSPARRTVLHQRIAAWLEQNGGTPAELARHFLEAAAAGCATKAVHYATQAAERAETLLAYDEAAQHYEDALEALTHDSHATATDRARLLRCLGEAQARRGKSHLAIQALAEAAKIAREQGAADLFAHAVLGLGREHPPEIEARDLIAQLEEGLEVIGPGDGNLRARLLARLDLALSPIASAHVRRASLAQSAVEMVRRSGDPETLLYVVEYTRLGFVGRESREELHALGHELASLASGTSQRERALLAHQLRIAVLFELGETAEAEIALELYATLAEEAGLPWYSWYGLRLRTVQELQAGRFQEAECVAASALTFTDRMDHANVGLVFAAQMLALQWLRGGFEEMQATLVPVVTTFPEQRSFQAQLALVRLQLGNDAAARSGFDALAADAFDDIPRDASWLVCLAYLSEVCAGVEDRERAGRLYELFTPYADRVIGCGPNVNSLGHGSRYVAALAATLGRWEEAESRLDEAVRAHERMGARPWLAYSLLDQARLHRRRPARGRERTAARSRAAAAAGRAAQLARDLGMTAVEKSAQDLVEAR